MSPDKMRVSIAEACGWKLKITNYKDGSEAIRSWVSPNGIGKDLPDYPNDLNAMADALAYIQDRKNEYGQWLIAILTHDWPEEDVENVQKLTNAICTSTAAQWAEAFLRTIGKWEEE